MSETDLEIFRLKMRLESVYVLLRALFSGIVNSAPDDSKAFLEAFAQLRKEHDKVALPDLPGEYSDFAAAEYQEALDDLLSYVEEGLRRPS